MSELPVDDLEALANEHIGEVLRITRIHYGKTLEDVESALRIRSYQITAIEQGDISNLPGKVYALGFVRSYAEYLGVDGSRAVELFKSQYMGGDDEDIINIDSQNPAFPVHAFETKTPASWLVALSVLLAIAFFIGWGAYNKSENSDNSYVQNIPEYIKNHVDKEILATSPAISEPILLDKIIVENMSSDDEQKSGIILNIINSSWVEIKNADGKIIVSNILEAGDQYFVPNSPSLSMSLGNAANVEIIIDGRALKPLGKDGDVRRDIPLNTSYLKTLEFQDTQ